MWVCRVCVLFGCGCWLLKRKREREIIIIKKNKKLYLNKVAPNKKKKRFGMLGVVKWYSRIDKIVFEMIK